LEDFLTDMKEVAGMIQADDAPRAYNLRELNAGDERVVGGMVAKVTGDPRIQNAVASGEQMVIVLAIASALLERVSREIALWCASLTQEDKGFKLKEYRKEERAEAMEEGRLPAPEGEVRFRMEEDMIDKMDSYPSGTYLNIMADVIESPGFEGFLGSSRRLGTAAQKGFERFQTPSKNASTSLTKK
jgi:hypothetical protein